MRVIVSVIILLSYQNSYCQGFASFTFARSIESGFIYGNLESLFPSKTYIEIKTIRERNWNILKGTVNAKKQAGLEVPLLGGRLEVYFPFQESIIISNGQLVDLKATGELTVVVYPFTSRKFEEWVFDATNGGSFRMTNIIFQAPEKSSKYETYTSVLKKNGDVRLIEITEALRSNFWNELQVGAVVHYSWPGGVTLQTGIVSSFNSGLGQITLTADINASVSSNTSGNIGMYFKEEISISDYNTYGDFWIPLVSGSTPCINFLRCTSIGINYGSVTLNNSSVKNFFLGIYGNNNNLDIVFQNNCTFSGSAIGIAIYGSNVVGTNSRVLNSGTLTVTDNAYVSVGSSSDNDVLFGSGVYIHPNIEVNSTGVVNVINNISEGWIQYSSSGEKPIIPGVTSYFAEFNGSGNGQRDIITSNSMLTTFDQLNISLCLLGGNTVINGGVISGLHTSGNVRPSGSASNYNITINNSDIYGSSSFSWGGTILSKLDVYFNSCTFHPVLFSSFSNMVFSDYGTVNLKKISFAGCSIDTNPAITGRLSNLIRLSYIDEVYIDGMTVETPIVSQDLRILGNDNTFPAGLITTINNNSVIPSAVAIRSGSATINLTSVLRTADGSSSSFSGTTTFFQTTPFSISATGVTTTSSSLTGTTWSAEFGSVPTLGVKLIAVGQAK